MQGMLADQSCMLPPSSDQCAGGIKKRDSDSCPASYHLLPGTYCFPGSPPVFFSRAAFFLFRPVR